MDRKIPTMKRRLDEMYKMYHLVLLTGNDAMWIYLDDV